MTGVYVAVQSATGRLGCGQPLPTSPVKSVGDGAPAPVTAGAIGRTNVEGIALSFDDTRRGYRRALSWLSYSHSWQNDGVDELVEVADG